MARKKSIVSSYSATLEWQTLTGDDNSNIMTSTFNGTTLEGLGGNDTLTTTLVGRDVSDNLFAYQYGGGGIDTLELRVSGRSRYIGAVLEGGGGADTITANISNIAGGAFDWSNLSELYILGGAGDDIIRVSGGITGGRNVMEAYGGAGNDDIQLSGSVRWGSTSLYAEGGEGDDIIVATSSNYDYKPNAYIELYGGAGNDQLTAQTKQGFYPTISLYGGDGDDILTAQEQMGSTAWNGGKTWLYGDAGNDVLRGGMSVDNMHGGADADRFEVGPGLQDTILDFNLAEGDRLVLTQGSVAGAVVTSEGLVVNFTGGSVLLAGVSELDLTLAFA